MKRRGLVLGLAAAALIGLLVWFLGSDRDDDLGTGGAPAEENASEHPLLSGEERPGLEGAEATPKAAPEAAPVGEAADDETKRRTPKSPGIFTLRLVGPTDLSGRPARVHVEVADKDDIRRPYLWHKAESNPKEVDAWRLLREGAGRLLITVMHPDFVDASEIVQIADLGGEIVIRLQRALVVVGRIVNERGEPNVRRTSVGLFFTAPDAPMHDPRTRYSSRPADSAGSGADGRFRLRVLNPGTYLFLAGDHAFPVTARLLRIVEGEPTDLGDVVVREGVSISGRDLLQGRPVPKARLQLSPSNRTGSFFYGLSGMVRWYGGDRVLKDGREATTDDKGRFEVTGLEPGRYTAWIAELDVADLIVASGLRRSEEFVAPRDNLDVDVRGHRLDLGIVSNGSPEPDAFISAASKAAGSYAGGTSNEQGIIALLLQPNATYELLAGAEGREGAKASIKTGAAGASSTLTMDLGAGAAPAQGTLRVRLLRADGASVKGAAFRLVYDDAERTTTVEYSWGATEYEFELAAGRGTLTAVPGGLDKPDLSAFDLPVESPFEIVAEKETTLDLTISRGGRLLVVLRDAKGAFVKAGIEVRDSLGQELKLTYRVQGVRGTLLNASRLTGNGPATSNEVLAPGSYEVEITPKDGNPLRKKVNVVAGKTTRVEITLPK